MAIERINSIVKALGLFNSQTNKLIRFKIYFWLWYMWLYLLCLMVEIVLVILVLVAAEVLILKSYMNCCILIIWILLSRCNFKYFLTLKYFFFYTNRLLMLFFIYKKRISIPSLTNIIKVFNVL